MIYNNLFKPNKTHSTKSTIKYMVDSRAYTFNIIFDKKFTSISTGIGIGLVAVLTTNILIFGVVTANNSRKLESLLDENLNYDSSISTLTSQKNDYIKYKENSDNIFNISDKPTKWSSILDAIAKQLPYDGVLSKVTTMSSSEIDKFVTSQNQNESNGNKDSSSSENNSENSENKKPTDSDTTQDTSSQNNDTNNTKEDTNGNSKDKQQKNSYLSKEKNVITIEGKSLSMVNISLFLDKLDKLDIFSKVECFKAEKDDDSHYYDFIIFANMNK